MNIRKLFFIAIISFICLNSFANNNLSLSENVTNLNKSKLRNTEVSLSLGKESTDDMCLDDCDLDSLNVSFGRIWSPEDFAQFSTFAYVDKRSNTNDVGNIEINTFGLRQKLSLNYNFDDWSLLPFISLGYGLGRGEIDFYVPDYELSVFTETDLSVSEVSLGTDIYSHKGLKLSVFFTRSTFRFKNTKIAVEGDGFRESGEVTESTKSRASRISLGVSYVF